jgi:hypothetical protein
MDNPAMVVPDAMPAPAAPVLTIATVNLWNRLNAATRQVAGARAA